MIIASSETLMNRLDAIRDIRMRRGLKLHFLGKNTSFDLIIRRSNIKGGSPVAIISCRKMRRDYQILLHIRQVLSLIRRWYPRHYWSA